MYIIVNMPSRIELPEKFSLVEITIDELRLKIVSGWTAERVYRDNFAIRNPHFPGSLLRIARYERPKNMTNTGFIVFGRSLYGVGKFKRRSIDSSRTRIWQGMDRFDGWNFDSSGRGLVLTQKSLFVFECLAPNTNGPGAEAFAMMMAMTLSIEDTPLLSKPKPEIRSAVQQQGRMFIGIKNLDYRCL